jgi:sortase (surface protein transpeptidase)
MTWLAVGPLLASLLWLTALGPAAAQEVTPVAGTVPVAIDIPSIGTHASIVPLGEEPDGTMSAPDDPDTVGWYALGLGLGTPGNAYFDGHVDWAGQLRAFGLLRRLTAGERITITDASGTLYTYGVEWTRLYRAETAPLAEVFAHGETEQITLITCGGTFDPQQHLYDSRWVVRASRILAADAASGVVSAD